MINNTFGKYKFKSTDNESQVFLIILSTHHYKLGIDIHSNVMQFCKTYIQAHTLTFLLHLPLIHACLKTQILGIYMRCEQLIDNQPIVNIMG